MHVFLALPLSHDWPTVNEDAHCVQVAVTGSVTLPNAIIGVTAHCDCVLPLPHCPSAHTPTHPRWPLQRPRFSDPLSRPVSLLTVTTTTKLSVRLVQLWISENLISGISCGKTAVSWQLWESWKLFGWNNCQPWISVINICYAPRSHKVVYMLINILIWCLESRNSGNSWLYISSMWI
jgi:hypothetical protein